MYEDLRQISTFTVVAETGSFVKAANKLGISPAVVSHHVSQLEKRFDTALLFRSTRLLRLTDAGAALALRGRKMLDAADEATSGLKSESLKHEGRLRITAPSMFQDQLITFLLPRFMKEHPLVDVEIQFSDRRVNLIRDGIDLAFRVGHQNEASLESKPFYSGARRLCASPDFMAGTITPQMPEDLNGMHAIYHLYGVDHWRLINRANKNETRQVRPINKIAVNSIYASYQMALLGGGMAILPDALAEPAIEQGKLVPLLEDWAPPDFQTYFVFPRNAGSRYLSVLFYKYCLAEFENLDRAVA